ncbi:MAG: hypothetical protein ABSG32_09795 [Terriglobia bacterium]
MRAAQGIDDQLGWLAQTAASAISGFSYGTAALREKTGGEVFSAPQGCKIVAGSSAPGKSDGRSPILKGAHYPGPWDARLAPYQPDSTLSGSGLAWVRFPGTLSPAILSIPLRGSEMESTHGFFRRLFSQADFSGGA